MMNVVMTHDDFEVLSLDVPGLPYLGEAMSWSCLATVLRFVAKLRCTGRSRDKSIVLDRVMRHTQIIIL